MYCVYIEFDRETEQEAFHYYDWFEEAEEAFKEFRRDAISKVCLQEVDVNTKRVSQTIATYLP